MLDEYWMQFMQTGKIDDYLKYKEHEVTLKAEANESINQGACNKRTDYRGE